MLFLGPPQRVLFCWFHVPKNHSEPPKQHPLGGAGLEFLFGLLCFFICGPLDATCYGLPWFVW